MPPTARADTMGFLPVTTALKEPNPSPAAAVHSKAINMVIPVTGRCMRKIEEVGFLPATEPTMSAGLAGLIKTCAGERSEGR